MIKNEVYIIRQQCKSVCTYCVYMHACMCAFVDAYIYACVSVCACVYWFCNGDAAENMQSNQFNLSSMPLGQIILWHSYVATTKQCYKYSFIFQTLITFTTKNLSKSKGDMSEESANLKFLKLFLTAMGTPFTEISEAEIR